MVTVDDIINNKVKGRPISYLELQLIEEMNDTFKSIIDFTNNKVDIEEPLKRLKRLLIANDQLIKLYESDNEIPQFNGVTTPVFKK